jgi:peptide/nickel transport system permease protein
MLGFLARRLLLAIPTLLGVAVITFLILRVLPGDIVEVKLRADGGAVTQEMVQKERVRLGLDKPVIAQFGDWMKGLATFDLGNSMWTGRPVTQEIGIRLALSAQLAVMATIVALVLAVPLGTLSALARGTWIDGAIRLLTVAGLAVPSFWLGMLIIMGLLAVNAMPPLVFRPFFDDPWSNLKQLFWPALAIGYRYAAVVARMIRSSIIDVMGEDYIRTARAKGLPEGKVVGRHGLRNAMLPSITVIGLEFAFLFGGLAVTEQVFNLNGIGKLFVQAVTQRDFVLIQTIVMMSAVIFVVVNLIVDLLYAALDPRLRVR